MSGLPKDKAKLAASLAAHLGFKGVPELLVYLVDDLAFRTPMKKPNPRPMKRGSTTARVMKLAPGTRFTVDHILKAGEKRASIGVVLHYLHRQGVIAMLSGARRTPNGWEPAIFVRK